MARVKAPPKNVFRQVGLRKGLNDKLRKVKLPLLHILYKEKKGLIAIRPDRLRKERSKGIKRVQIF